MYYNTICIDGFKFFDSTQTLIWQIGCIEPGLTIDTVELEDNEKIVGVVAKWWRGHQSIYTEFQFQIALLE